MTYSKTELIGRLVADPEIKTYSNNSGGGTLANFRLAVSTSKDKTEFYNCTAFGKLSEIVQKYTAKGSQVHVSGTFESNQYQKDVNGTPVNMVAWNLVVRDFHLLGKREDNPANNNQPVAPQNQQQNPFVAPQQQSAPQAGVFSGFGVTEDDLPF